MKILVILTGGTFGSAEVGDRLSASPNDSLGLLKSKVNEIFPADVTFSYIQPFSKLSENIAPEDWTLLVAVIHEHMHAHDATIVVHGTDTMAYSAAAISYIQSISRRHAVVFTGANYPIGYSNTDAVTNFVQSVTALRYFVAQDIKGVFIVFNGRRDPNTEGLIHIGTRTKKDKWEQSCYRSFYLGVASIGKVEGLEEASINRRLYDDLFASSTNFKVSPDYASKDVGALKIYPGMRPSAVDALVNEGCRFILLEIYNSGTAAADDSELSLVPAIRNAVNSGVPVFAVSQHEGQRGVSMDVYETSAALLKAGIIPLNDMIWEAALPKLMLAAGNFKSNTDATNFMLENISGEIIGEGCFQNKNKQQAC